MYYRWIKRIHLKQFQNYFNDSYKKVAVRTNGDQWVNTQDPVIILFSVDSVFHEGQKGALNVEVLTYIIQKHVRGEIIILMTEKAHVNVSSLLYDDNRNEAFERAIRDAQSLINKFNTIWNEFQVEFWYDFINKDPHYESYFKQIADRYEVDNQFRTLIQQDAERTYTEEREREFPDKQIYINKTIEDLLEQAAYVLVIAKKGYRFAFYPGRQNGSLLYIAEQLVPSEQRVAHIHVNISFEKK